MSAFGCPRCGRRSANPTDEVEGYCGECHDFTGMEPNRYGQLPALNMVELRDLLDAVRQRLATLGPDGDPATPQGQDLAASLRSVDVATNEAMYGARPIDGLAVIADLRRSLERMPQDLDGARRIAGSMLDTMEGLVRDLRTDRLVEHLRTWEPGSPSIVRGVHALVVEVDEAAGYRPA